MNRHQNNLYQLCLVLLRDPDEAEEAAQVAFIKAYQSLGSFKGASSFRTWVTRIGLNHCKDRLRQKRRWRTYNLDSLLQEGRKTPVALVQQPSALPQPEEAPPELLARLSDGEQAVIRLLQEKEGLSYEEMGRELGLSLDGLKGRLKRARAKIQKYLRDALSGGD